jgi:hypothetical protein
MLVLKPLPYAQIAPYILAQHCIYCSLSHPTESVNCFLIPLTNAQNWTIQGEPI